MEENQTITRKDYFSFVFDVKPLNIKCLFSNIQINFFYAPEDRKNENDFIEFGMIDLEEKGRKNLTIISSLGPCFTFLLLANSKTKRSIIDITNLNRISNDLYKTLFINSASEEGDGGDMDIATDLNPILMIANISGLLYYLKFTNKDVKLNKAKLLLDTQSRIILMDTYYYKSPLENMSKESKKKTSNCLYMITVTGKVFLYVYSTKYLFHAFNLPHSIIKCCIRYKDYIFYSTQEFDIYFFGLNSMLRKDFMPNYVTKCKGIECFYINENEKLFAKDKYDRDIEINTNIEELLNSDCNKTEAEKETIQSLLDQLCTIGNKIVKSQKNIDNLSEVIKQLQIMKNLEIRGSDGDTTNSQYFSFTLKPLFFDRKRYLELRIKNKNTIFQANKSSKNQLCTYSIDISMRLHKDGKNCWINNSASFIALYPNAEQKLLFEIEEEIQRNIYPDQLIALLTIDFRKAVANYDKLLNETSSDFSICIYKNKIDPFDYAFSYIPDPTISDELEKNQSIFLTVLEFFKTNEKTNVEKWNQIKISNLPLDGLDKSVTDILPSKKSKSSETFIDLLNTLSINLNYTSKNTINLLVSPATDNSSSSDMSFVNLINFKNDFIMKKLLNENEKLEDALVKNLSSKEYFSLLEESVSKVDEIENELNKSTDDDDRSLFKYLELAQKALNIYLNIRNKSYGSIIL